MELEREPLEDILTEAVFSRVRDFFGDAGTIIGHGQRANPLRGLNCDHDLAISTPVKGVLETVGDEFRNDERY